MTNRSESYLIRWENFLLEWKLDHLFFWFTYATIYSLILPMGSTNWESFFIANGLLSFHAIAAYFNNDFLIPRFLLTRHYLFYLTSLTLGILSVCFPLMIFSSLVITNPEFESNLWSDTFFLFLIINVLFSVILTMVLKLLKQWYKDQKTTTELKKMQLETELQFLKAQINPHFLFNSLNNLYALTLAKSDAAPEFVLKLSNILRYILYESNQGKVSVRTEMDHVKDYIAVERLRLGDKVKIDVDIEEELKDELVEPMLFLTLVENAFKHSENVLPKDRFVKIHGKSLDDGFRFLVENSYSQNKTSDEAGGIGLRNIKKRLVLIYPNKHDIKSSSEDGVYRVDLIIKL